MTDPIILPPDLISRLESIKDPEENIQDIAIRIIKQGINDLEQERFDYERYVIEQTSPPVTLKTIKDVKLSGILKANLGKIRELCEFYQIKRLAVFGPSLYDSSYYVVEFLVIFKLLKNRNWVDAYFNFRSDLELIFDRQVQVIEEKQHGNKQIVERIKKTAVEIYSSEG